MTAGVNRLLLAAMSLGSHSVFSLIRIGLYEYANLSSARLDVPASCTVDRADLCIFFLVFSSLLSEESLLNFE